jgi:two-component system cell cycle response regulator DivK
VTVLLVDDYPDALEVWEIFLTAEGCHVITANDGEQALEIARTQRPDVIVMDFQMPGLSGPSVAEALRQNPVTAQIPLIAVTGHRLELAEARRLGFVALIVKPCTPDALLEAIRRVALDAHSAPAPPGS